MINQGLIGMVTLVSYLLIVVYIIIKLKIVDLFIDRDYEKDCIRIQNNREMAADIIDEFEELLCKKNIVIPNKDRENNEYEACIYAGDYYDLEDKIIEILNRKEI